MMEWSYLYLAIPPAVAVAGAVLGARLVRRSTARIDRMQTQFDREAAVRSQIKGQIPWPKDISSAGPFEVRTSYGSGGGQPMFTPKGSVHG